MPRTRRRSCGHRVAVDDQVARLDHVAFLHDDVPALGDQVLDRLEILVRRQDAQAALVLVVLAELDPALELGDDRRVLGPARLEQLGDARQTAGDVAGLAGLTRQTREHVAGMHLQAVLDRHDGADRQVVAGLAARRQRDRVAVLVLQQDRGTQIARAGVLAPIDDLLAGLARGLVDHLAERGAVDQVVEHDRARRLGDHRQGVRVPLGQHLALVDLRIRLDAQPRAVGHLLPQLLAADLVVDHDLGVAAEDHLPVHAVADQARVDQPHHADARALDRRLLGRGLRRTADVEGAHGQLRARLADRLGGDDAHRLADVDGRAARQVAAVAAAADADLAVAGQDRAHMHAVDARLVDPLAQLLVEQRVARCQHLAGARVDDVLGHGPAEDALAQILVAARGGDGDRPLAAAILVDDDAVLRHVDQAPGQVARVRGLQARCRPDPCGRRASS